MLKHLTVKSVKNFASFDYVWMVWKSVSVFPGNLFMKETWVDIKNELHCYIHCYIVNT